MKIRVRHWSGVLVGFAVATLFAVPRLDAAEQAATAICLAVAANIFFKAVLAASIGGRELIRGILPGFAAVLLGIVSAYLLLVY